MPFCLTLSLSLFFLLLSLFLSLCSDEQYRRHPVAGGLGDGGDALMLNCPTPVLRHHTPWTPLSKDATGGSGSNLKYKGDGYYNNQDEPLNFCKSSGAVGVRGHVADGGWALRPGSGGYRGSLNMSPTAAARLGKMGHYGKPYRMSPSYHHSTRGDTYMPKLYGSLQGGGGGGCNDGVEGYCTVDGIKSENGGYDSHGGVCYDGRLLPQMPIKVEQDSDSENGCDAYGRPWGCRQPLDRRYGNGGGGGVYEGSAGVMQMKAEGEFYDQYSPCQRSKAIVSPGPFNGHYQNLCSPGAGTGVAGRPLKCVLNKEPPTAVTQFSPPQRLAPSDPLCGSQTINCMDGHGHGYGSGAMLDHKGYGPQDYKLGYEVKGHGLLHSIKREPMDSPPWHDGSGGGGGGGHEVPPVALQRGVMPNCMMGAVAHKTNPYIYMQ